MVGRLLQLPVGLDAGVAPDKELIDPDWKRPDPNMKGVQWMTPLRCACRYGRSQCAALLVAAGVNVNFRNSELASDAMGFGSCLTLATDGGFAALVQALIKWGAEVNYSCCDTYLTALMIAAARGHAGCLGARIGAGADMHRVNNDEPCTTALMLAARHHHPECVQLLLAAGVDVDQLSPEDSRTALMNAAAAGQLPTVHLLIGACADLSIRSAHGETALSLARSHGQEECAALLTGV
jgi:ankyrin repeat protein